MINSPNNNESKKLKSTSIISPISNQPLSSPRRSSNKKKSRHRNSIISRRSLIPLLNRHQIVSTGVPKNETDADIAHLAAILEDVDLKMEQKIMRVPPEHLFSLLLYILQKPIRNESDIIIIRYYLSHFPTLTSALSLKKNLNDPMEILHKLSIFIQGEHYEKNRIICMNGEVGDKFYLIFKGTVSVLVPNPYTEELTAIEYTNHLYNLRRLREFDLLNRTIDSNRDKYMSLEVLNLASDDYDCYNLNKGEIIGEEEYINRLIPQKGVVVVTKESDGDTDSKKDNELIIALMGIQKEDDSQQNDLSVSDSEEDLKINQEEKSKNKSKIYHFTIWTYHKVCELGVGKSFGDIALGQDISNRTATVIANENVVLGSLHKDVYQICIKDAQEKHRKLNIEYVLSQKLFENFNPDVFERYYFNFFRNVRAKRGDILFSQGNNPTEIYFLFDGEVEIQSKISLSFCTAMDRFIRKIDSERKEKLSKSNKMKGSVYKF